MTPMESMLALLEAAYAEGYRHGYGNGHYDATVNETDHDPADYGEGFGEWVSGQESPGPFDITPPQLPPPPPPTQVTICPACGEMGPTKDEADSALWPYCSSACVGFPPNRMRSIDVVPKGAGIIKCACDGPCEGCWF